MDTFLTIGGWSLFILAILAGILLNFIGLFGNWVILAAITVAWLVSGFHHFGWICLVILIGLAIAAEVLEAIAASYGTIKFGGDKRSAFSALIGCILGALVGTPFIPVPIIGTLIGACLGAFVAAFLFEYLQREKQVHHAAWTGIGAALGRIAGLFAKAFIGFVMLGIAALFF